MLCLHLITRLIPVSPFNTPAPALTALFQQNKLGFYTLLYVPVRRPEEVREGSLRVLKGRWSSRLDM